MNAKISEDARRRLRLRECVEDLPLMSPREIADELERLVTKVSSRNNVRHLVKFIRASKRGFTCIDVKDRG